jgi:hypothetical protein
MAFELFKSFVYLESWGVFICDEPASDDLDGIPEDMQQGVTVK